MATTRYTLRPRLRWTSGALTCVALFAFGGLILWGLFRAPRARAPVSPDVPWGVPQRPLRVVSIDLGAWTQNPLDAAEIARGFDPDVVLVQRVAGDKVVQLAEALGMQRSFHPRNFVRLGPGHTPGCLVLSKHPVYDATPLAPERHPEHPTGVWATVVVDGRRFAVASVDAGPSFSGTLPWLASAAMLRERQGAAGDPPLVAAFLAPPMTSARSQLLETAKLTAAAGAPQGDGDGAAGAGTSPLVGVAGPWRVVTGATSQPSAMAPGILWVEVGPE